MVDERMKFSVLSKRHVSKPESFHVHFATLNTQARRDLNTRNGAYIRSSQASTARRMSAKVSSKTARG